MKEFLKKIFYLLPRFTKRYILSCYENLHSSPFKIKRFGTKNTKPRILFYHVSGLSFGGTEKFLQIIAKYLNKEKYDVFFMYSPKPRGNTATKLDGRRSYFNDSRVNLIEFQYDEMTQKYPYEIKNMRPHIKNIIQEKNIDLLVTAGSGYSEFPFNNIRNIPIILLNIFGSPNVQKNILKNVCLSKEVSKKIESIVEKNKIEIMGIPSEGPTPDSFTLGQKIREKFEIKDTDMVFGRIGRPDNAIFDPIGIRAFKKIVKEFPDTHYIIMSPPPVLVEMVEREQIPNVHFLPSSAKEEDVWAFHQSIDAVAHFRNDGESFGLNIVESMLCGKPVITHRSHIWNAHLEYLEPAFSRVANKDNVDTYASFMKEFTLLKQQGKLKELGEKAREKSEEFLIENQIVRFEKLVDESIVH